MHSVGKEAVSRAVSLHVVKRERLDWPVCLRVLIYKHAMYFNIPKTPGSCSVRPQNSGFGDVKIQCMFISEQSELLDGLLLTVRG